MQFRGMLFFVGLLSFKICFALDGIAISKGLGVREVESDISTQQVALQWRWQKQWLSEGEWFWGGYWNASITAGDNDTQRYGSHFKYVAVAPVFRFQPKQPLWHSISPFIDFGIGISWFNDDKLTRHRSDSYFQQVGYNYHGNKLYLGSHVLFEDRFGIGIRFGKRQQYELSYTILHYSHAGLFDSKNDGLNIRNLEFRYWF